MFKNIFGSFYQRKDRVSKFVMWREDGQKVVAESFRKAKPKKGKNEVRYLADFFKFVMLRLGYKDWSKNKLFIEDVTSEEYDLLHKYLSSLRRDKNG